MRTLELKSLHAMMELMNDQSTPRFMSALTPCRPVMAAIAIAVVLSPAVAFACNVPVFRYALEHWHPDAYRGVVFHRGPLAEADQKQLAVLKSGEPGSPVNVSIRTVDLDADPSSADAALAASLKDAPLPQLVIQYPARHQVEETIWSGPLQEAGLKALADSPARQELIKRLIAGQTAIWVLIESGDSGQDDAAALTLDEELKNLQTTLKLPVQTDAPEDAIGDGPELRVDFSVLRVSRTDSKELALVAMLMHSEADLSDLSEPLVFPVFGRCRALLPLVGPGISAENIRGSARFLAGACSCQVKEQNPGFDLLVTADWGELIPWAKSAVSGPDALANPKPPEVLPIASGAPPKAAPAAMASSAASQSTPPQIAAPPAEAGPEEIAEAAPLESPSTPPSGDPVAARELVDAPAAVLEGAPASVPMGLMAIGAIVALTVAFAGFLVGRR
ncbi:hypothetical protein Pan44_13740 [Caulifigura coniformis]|uniref:Uncharacterized protein n=1 Tax=Caulifigura coniformis TaxID=2527983 RepID=A0A517SB41_9PLAN|nr:hypothetical protein [Caulifigura coniformis]QDT53357.1 hypothetical protein Pan44_13740 [Caulifigura coniformis]